MSAGMFARGARDAPGTAGPRDSGSSGWGPRMSEPVRGELPRDAVGALLAQGWAFMERHGYLVLLVGLTLLWLWPRISEYLSTRAKVQKLQAAKAPERVSTLDKDRERVRAAQLRRFEKEQEEFKKENPDFFKKGSQHKAAKKKPGYPYSGELFRVLEFLA